MGNRRVVTISQRRPERGKVACLVRVDHDHSLRCGHLDEAKFRIERIFRNELGVEADPVYSGEVTTQFVEFGRSCDGVVGQICIRGDQLKRAWLVSRVFGTICNIFLFAEWLKLAKSPGGGEVKFAWGGSTMGTI